MIRSKGIVEVHEGYADTSELKEAVDILPDGEYGYLLFDKNKNRSLPQLKFLFGYLLKTLSEELEGNPNPEALYRYFEELYAPIHSCKIPGEANVFEYFDLKNEPTAEMDYVIERIIIMPRQNGILTCLPVRESKLRKQQRFMQVPTLILGRIIKEKSKRQFRHDGSRKCTFAL